MSIMRSGTYSGYLLLHFLTRAPFDRAPKSLFSQRRRPAYPVNATSLYISTDMERISVCPYKGRRVDIIYFLLVSKTMNEVDTLSAL